MSSIPDEVVARTCAAGTQEKEHRKMLRKRKISYRYSAHRIRRAETAAGRIPSGKWTERTREHPARIVRQAEETDSVRLQ